MAASSPFWSEHRWLDTAFTELLNNCCAPVDKTLVVGTVGLKESHPKSPLVVGTVGLKEPHPKSPQPLMRGAVPIEKQKTEK